jgi:hypothetical protein
MADQTDPLAELERLHEAATSARGNLDAAALERAESALWVVAKNRLPDLLKQARLAATLTSILCTEEGQDVVERAKALVENAAPPCAGCGADTELYRGLGGGCSIGIRCSDCGDVFCGRCSSAHFRTTEREQIDSLRAALAAKDAELNAVTNLGRAAAHEALGGQPDYELMTANYDAFECVRTLTRTERQLRAELARMKERVVDPITCPHAEVTTVPNALVCVECYRSLPLVGKP